MARDIADQDRTQAASTDWGRTTEPSRVIETPSTREVPVEIREKKEEFKGETRSAAEVTAGGSMGEAIGGLAAVVLAIIGLAGGVPGFMMTIGVIALGVALLLKGLSVAARFHALMRQASRDRVSRVELTGGMSAEFLAGAAGIVLGILGLVGIVPTMLCAVSVIVFGSALILGTGMANRLANLQAAGEEEWVRIVSREATEAAAGTQVLVGLGAIVLGILALVNIVPLTLTLVAILCVGASVLFTGTAVSGRMASVISHS